MMASDAEDDLPPPICLIHGLFGWGETSPLWGAAPCYFPIKELRQARPQGGVVAVECGSTSSNHDRACEAFAQLMGTRTDYGEVHASRCGHLRFGTDHSGRALLRRWSESHPIHLIGHSFGGNTALALVRLLAEDFWGLGTSEAWVCSVSTVCSPLRGCTLPFVWGLDGETRVRNSTADAYPCCEGPAADALPPSVAGGSTRVRLSCFPPRGPSASAVM